MTWVYGSKPVTDEMIEGYVGFVYCITNLLNGKKYLGKKLLNFTRSKKPLKGQIRKRKVVVPSDWETYFGSNKELLEDVAKHGEEHFRREVLRFCKTKSECNYHEAKEQFAADAIISDRYYNSWIICKVHRNKSLDT